MTTSRMILALISEELQAWAIYNAEMIFMISFLITNVNQNSLECQCCS
jgi:hypothetical protein